MKKLNDDELQEWMEENRHNLPDSANDEMKAYQMLFDALKTEPGHELPFDFSAKVVRRIQAETKRNSELSQYLKGILILALSIAGIYSLLLALKPFVGTTALNNMLAYKWAFVLVVFGFFTIQYFDQVMVKLAFLAKRK